MFAESPCRRWCAVAALLAASLLAAPSPAAAKDLDGRLAVGVEQTLAGASGIAFRYFLSESVGLTSTVGLDVTVVDREDSSSAFATALTSSLGVAFHFARSLHAHLGVGLRANVAWRTAESARLLDPAASGGTVQFALEVPLFLEFFLSDHFSVGVATGLLLNFVPERGAILTPAGPGGTTTPGSIGFGLGAGSVSGTLTVLYYF